MGKELTKRRGGGASLGPLLDSHMVLGTALCHRFPHDAGAGPLSSIPTRCWGQAWASLNSHSSGACPGPVSSIPHGVGVRPWPLSLTNMVVGPGLNLSSTPTWRWGQFWASLETLSGGVDRGPLSTPTLGQYSHALFGKAKLTRRIGSYQHSHVEKSLGRQQT